MERKEISLQEQLSYPYRCSQKLCLAAEQLHEVAYADEADLLNVALFGCAAKAWREANPELAKNSNIRDYASIAELTVLSNLETHNAELIKQGLPKAERFERLQEIAQYQLHVLKEAELIKELPSST